MRSHLSALALSACVLLTVASQAHAAKVVDLGSIVPNAINNHGVIVGTTFDPNNDDADGHAAMWQSGKLTRLLEPAGTTASDAYGVNASGRTAGDFRSADGNIHAVYWDGTTDVGHQIGPVSSGTVQGDFSQAEGVTTAGEVVGTTLADNIGSVGFLRTAGGAINLVGEADRDKGNTSVAGITPDGRNILGHVGTAEHNGAATGWYLWPSAAGSGIKLPITPFPSGSQILGGALVAQYGNALASDGTVMGYQGDGAARAYYLRLPGGSLTPVNGLVGHNGVNAKHVVIGTIAYTDPTFGLIPHAALWKPDGTVVDLNDLLPANSGYILFDGLEINDNGDIVGLAAHNDQQVGFLMPAGYVVDSTGDQVDAVPGDGACLTAQATCTLRAALQEVSGTANADEPISVSFNLPAGATTIAPGSALPTVTKPIAIDGTIAGGAKVILEGANAGAGSAGLWLKGAESTVRAMDIEHFKGPGVRVEASDVQVGALPTDTPTCAFPCNVLEGNATGVAVTAGTHTKVTGNRLVGNAKPAIDLGGDGRTPNDKSDADTGPNNRRNFPIGVLSEKDPVTKVVKVSGIAPDAQENDEVEIYAQSAVTAALGAEPTDYVGETEVTSTGGWSMDLPAGLPAADTFFSATVTTFDDGTSELSPICGDPDGDHNPDSDGDGLCDDWELGGIDSDDDGTVDLALANPIFGASPTHKDLYLEVDAMANGAGVNAPQQASIDAVVSAFAYAPVDNATGGTGIALHVNPGRPTVDDAAIPETDMYVGGTGPGTLDYIRNGTDANPCDGNFGSHDDRAAPDCFKRLQARALAFRWVLFGRTYHEENGSSGFSNGLGGNTLTVTLGQWDDANIVYGGGGAAQCHSFNDCRVVTDAGTLMHELGHSLGLHHGGRDDEQFKPNYLSVMNYMFQMRGRVKDRPLDYSRFALPSLNENSLTESAGILGGVDVLTRTRVKALWPHTGFYRAETGFCRLQNADTAGPIDWDGTSPVITESLLVHDKFCADPKTTLTSSEDWPDLRYSFRDQPGVLNAPTYAGDSSMTAPEETDAQLLAEAAHSDVDHNGVNDLADSCRIVAGSAFADANGNGFADICEPGMNRVQAFPGQANGGGGGGTGGGGGSTPPASGGGPAKDTTAPLLSKLSAKPSSALRARPHKKAKPATLRFTVSETSTVTFTGEQALKGRLKGKKCIAGGKKGKQCVSYRKLSGVLRVNAKAGANTATFAGKLGTKSLAAGTYRLTAVAIDAAGNRSKPATVTVTVR
jgi:uncharacterized membrane protein